MLGSLRDRIDNDIPIDPENRERWEQIFYSLTFSYSGVGRQENIAEPPRSGRLRAPEFRRIFRGGELLTFTRGNVYQKKKNAFGSLFNFIVIV